MANKISVVLDVATEKAISGLKGFKQSVAEADGAFGKVKAGAGSAFDSIKANAGLAGVAVVGAVGAMAAKSIEAASRLGESVNAVNVTFGKSAEGIKALGEEAAESVGLSNAAFNGLAVQFSSFADTIAGKGGDVVGTIDDMTTRAADFASVMNIDVAEAATIFQSGLAGETEPLKKFGIDLSAATVETYAYANGIGTAGEALTETQKIQARYGLLMEKTEKTAGDFANTSDGLANSQRILSAKLEDTAAKVGKDLAPAMAQVTGMLSDIIPIAGTMAVGVGKAFSTMIDAAYETGQALAGMVDALPFVEIAGLQEGIEHTAYEFTKLERATADVVAEFAKGAPTMEEFVAAMVAAGVSQDAQNLAMVEYRKQLDGVTDATGAVIDVTEDRTGATGELTAAEAKLALAELDTTEAVEAKKEADEAATEQQEKAKDAAEEYNEAMQEQRDATNDLVAAKTALVGGDIAVREAQRGAAAAIAELNVLTDEGKAGTEEFAVAQDAAATAMLGAAQAAADEQVKMAEARGAVVSAKEANQILKEKLIELASTLAPGSPLLSQILGYIDALDHIPRDITTNVRLIGDQIKGPKAAGGPVSANSAYLVGEQGPELFMPSANGSIVPNHALNGSGVGGAAMGGAPISITVNAGMGADGREIGDIIVGKIREYERRNGNGWRG